MCVQVYVCKYNRILSHQHKQLWVYKILEGYSTVVIFIAFFVNSQNYKNQKCLNKVNLIMD